MAFPSVKQKRQHPYSITLSQGLNELVHVKHLRIYKQLVSENNEIIH